jgi:hypothetical protein
MAKIAAVFPKTFEMLEGARAIAREFAAACPPTDISRVANARQFHDFLAARWRREVPKPAYLADVAACELACSEVRAEVRADLGERDSLPDRTDESAPRHSVRRHPGIILLRCKYDVRRIFEEASGAHAEPPMRDTRLAVTMLAGVTVPAIFELLPVVFDLLAVLDDWTDPATLGRTPEFNRVLDDLVEHRLLEARR